MQIFEYVEKWDNQKVTFSRRFYFKGKMPDYSRDCFLVGAFSF